MWRDVAWVLDMLLASRKAVEYAQELTEERFLSSPLHQDAILRQLTVLGEAAKRVSGEFRDGHPEVPWKKIAGFRDVAVHDSTRASSSSGYGGSCRMICPRWWSSWPPSCLPRRNREGTGD